MTTEKRTLLPIKDVVAEVGVNRIKIWRMAKRGELKLYSNPRDRRERLLDIDEVRRALQPELIDSTTEGDQP